MARSSEVEQFLCREEMKADRKRFIYEAKAGRSIVSLQKEMNELGGNFSQYAVRNWVKLINFRVGIEAERINDINDRYEGLLPSSLLTAMVCLMHTSLIQLIDEFNRRSLSENSENPVTTKDLGTIISNFSARIISATSESNKIANTINYKNTVEAILEEVRLEAESTYQAESPESLPIIESIIDQVKEKLDLE